MVSILVLPEEGFFGRTIKLRFLLAPTVQGHVSKIVWVHCTGSIDCLKPVMITYSFALRSFKICFTAKQKRL